MAVDNRRYRLEDVFMAAKTRKSARELVKCGRPKAYTAAGLRKAVDDYFCSLCYLEQIMRNEPVILDEDPATGAVTYQRDKYGHILARRVPVLDGNGQPLQQLCWISPPGESDLCMRIGIHKSTWDRYGAGEDPEFRDVVERARGVVRAYLEGATESKGGTGALAKLERIYGLKAKVEVDVADGVEAYLRRQPGKTEW